MADIKGVFLQDGVVLVVTVSPDRKAAGVMIEKLRVTAGNLPGPVTAMKQATIHVPMNVAMGEAGATLRQVVRGFAIVGEGTRGLILAQLGGETHTIPLPAAGGTGDSFVYEANVALPAGRLYQATFFLLLERDADRPEFGGDLAVESLDVEILPAAKYA
jgi:hypothetical protein